MIGILVRDATAREELEKKIGNIGMVLHVLSAFFSYETLLMRKFSSLEHCSKVKAWNLMM